MLTPFLFSSHDKGCQVLFLGLLTLYLYVILCPMHAVLLHLLLHEGCFRSIADLRVVASLHIAGFNHVLGNGWIQLEFLMHSSHQREQITMRLPINKTLTYVEIFSILADLVMNNTVHDMDSRCHLWEHMRNMDSHEKRLVGALQYQRSPIVLACLIHSCHLRIREELIELADLLLPYTL